MKKFLVMEKLNNLKEKNNFSKKLSVSVIFQRNDTIARILNLKNYFYYILCGVSVNSLPEEPE